MPDRRKVAAALEHLEGAVLMLESAVPNYETAITEQKGPPVASEDRIAMDAAFKFWCDRGKVALGVTFPAEEG